MSTGANAESEECSRLGRYVACGSRLCRDLPPDESTLIDACPENATDPEFGDDDRAAVPDRLLSLERYRRV